MDTPIRRLFSHRPVVHHGSRCHQTWQLSRLLQTPFGKAPIARVRSAPSQWSYAVSYELEPARLRHLSSDDALIIVCQVRVYEGRLGIVATAGDGASFVSHERIVSATDSIETIRIWVRQPLEASSLVFRTTAPNGTATDFAVFDISGHVMKSGSTFPVSWLEKGTSIPLNELKHALEWAQTVWDDPFDSRHATTLPTGAIEIVDVHQLASLLGVTTTPNIQPETATKSLADWKMETDDGPILKTLWNAVAPKRHLEFGTWEGFGTTLVASVTDAEIWTLNLPEGETDSDGNRLYDTTDAGAFIGRLYRKAGYESRVHQILCDSRAFDTSSFEAQPFDTVLIDGGHTPEVVANDTAKALHVLRHGGTCVWHDFCPDPESLRQNLAPLGVVQAVVENFADWSLAFERMFWIRKSWILVGLGRK